MKTCLVLSLTFILAALTARADVAGDFHHLQRQLDSSILDIYEGSASVPTGDELKQDWQALATDLTDPAARSLVLTDFSFATPDDLAAKIGSSRARLQQIAALEMLENQRAGRVTETIALSIRIDRIATSSTTSSKT